MPQSNHPIAAHFSTAQQQRESVTLGMWLFLLTEVMLFGGLFTAYAIYRWMYQASFAEASHHLDLGLGTLNTIVLIGSSFTMVLAHQAAVENHRSGVIAFLSLTLLLGILFLGIKSIEYSHKFHDGLVPGARFSWLSEPSSDPLHPATERVELFFSLYFVMTGLHALHMLAGLGAVLILVVLSLAQRRIETPVALTGLYWHFVDIVWIFLFPLLYLIGHH
jgi:cytochrome c oxidase subunit 3